MKTVAITVHLAKAEGRDQQSGVGLSQTAVVANGAGTNSGREGKRLLSIWLEDVMAAATRIEITGGRRRGRGRAGA
jgi:hypothetical protein